MTYIDAMIANHADAAPFADNVQFTENTENTEVIGIGQGLWETATGDRRAAAELSDLRPAGDGCPHALSSSHGWIRFWR